MNKASISTITKELTANQQTAHNNNYANLANKDLEVYNSIEGKVLETLAGGKVDDNMIGQRNAVDPCNESSSDSATFTGSVTGWLARISARVISVYQTIKQHVQDTASHVSAAERLAWNVTSKIPNGTFLGVIGVTTAGSEVQLPVALSTLVSPDHLSNYFFYIHKNASSAACVQLNVSMFDKSANSFSNVSVSLFEFTTGANITSLAKDTLYMLQMSVSGTYNARIRAATADDFITF